jgi:hypothetical protein
MSLRNSQLDTALFNAVDSISCLRGAGIGYLDGMSSQVLRNAHLRPLGMELWVVFEEEQVKASLSSVVPSAAEAKSNWGKRFGDLFLNCGGAVLAGAAAATGVAAAPVTGGSSAILTWTSGAAAIAGAAQCGISIGQVTLEFMDPGVNERFLDEEDWFKSTGYVLDGIQLVGITSAAPALYSNIGKILKMREVTGRTVPQLLKGLSRQERKLIAKEISRYGKTMSKKEWKRLVRVGAFPKIFSQQAISATVKSQLLESVGNALGLYSSASAGNIGLIVGVIQRG